MSQLKENLLIKQAGWCIWKCKAVLNMTDKDIGDIIGVSRPTMVRMKKDPGLMGLTQLIKLQEHLKTTGHMLKETELS